MVYDAIFGPPGPTGEKCTPPTKNVMFCHRGTRGKNYHFRDCLLQLFLGKQLGRKLISIDKVPRVLFWAPCPVSYEH